MIRESRSLHLDVFHMNNHHQYKATKTKNKIVSVMAKVSSRFSPERILNILDKIALCLEAWRVRREFGFDAQTHPLVSL